MARKVAAFARACDELRHDDVFQRREFRQQVMELIDKADADPAHARAGRIVHLRAVLPGDQDLACGGPFQQARHVQQRRLAGARLPDQSHHFTRPDGERLVAEMVSVAPLAPKVRVTLRSSRAGQAHS